MGRITKRAKAMIMRWNGSSIRISAQAVMSPSTTLKRYVRQYMNHDTFTDSTYVRSFIIPSASRSLLLRHNLILDLVVGRLRNDLLLDEFILPRVRRMLDDFLGVGIADPRQSLELFLSSRVEVERFGFFSGIGLGQPTN